MAKEMEELKYGYAQKLKTWEAEQQKQRQVEEAAAAANREEEAKAKQARTAQECAEAYRRSLIKTLSNLKILEMSSPLHLEDIYVQVRVREEEPLRYAKEEEMAPLAVGEPTELPQHSQIRSAEWATKAMSPEDALARLRRMVVLGDPGAGKTTMLRYLALRVAKGELSNLPELPVYVELWRFVDSKMDSLLDFVASDWAERYGFREARSYLQEQLEQGKAALLLDGLDEVLAGATLEEAKDVYKQVIDEVNRLDSLFLKAPIALTCRKAGWHRGLTAFHTLEVLDFSWKQIQDFVNNWFKADTAKAQGLQQALAGNLRMQTLAANPLILALIAIVYQKDLELPERRVELYSRCLEVLLREWDTHRNIKRCNQFTTDRKLNLLKEVAWHFHKSGKRYFPKDELLEVIADFLPTINIPREDNKAILEEIAAQYGLLKEQAHGWYGFGHLTFQEYFVALAVNDKGVIALPEVVAHRHEPWWEEVILLLAGMMNDGTPLLLGILGHSINLHSLPEGNLAANDDLFHSDLLLAAQCLAYARRITMAVLKDCIIAEVKNLLQTSPYKLDWERTTTVLVEINDKALIDELLAMLADNGINEEKRRSIASAFGKLADRSVAQRLLELLKSNPELDLFVRLSIIDALGALKATFAVSSLQEMLATENTTDAKERIIRTLGVIGNKEVASSLLDRLLDTTTDPKIKLSIAQALRNLKDESLTHRILDQLQDETIEWQVRWLLTESLEGLQESAKDSLMEMLESQALESQAIDEPVRVGIAATLGTWGVRESIPYLRNAIEDKVVPPSWQQGYYTSCGYIWGRITRVLNSLGDESVVPRLKQAYIQSPAIPDKWAAINALLEYKDRPEEIAHQLLERVRSSVDSGKETLLAYMRSLATKSLVPELCQLLTICNVYGIDEWGQIGIINGLAQVADDLETVKALQEMIPVMQTTENEYLRYAIYQALYRISQRARVRLRHDGQIEELQS
jgi:HEAT repeat protein